MSDFDFQLGASSVPALAFRVGFSGESEMVARWTTNGFQLITPVFVTIPSGPVLIRSIGISPFGSTIKIAESDSSYQVAQWVVDEGSFAQSGLSVRNINVPAGAEYTAFHTIRGPFVAILSASGTDDFVVQALGIPERAPATMWLDPNPPNINQGV